MNDETLPGYVAAPRRARLAQLALILHVLTTGALHATQPLVLAVYGEQGYREDGGGLDPLLHLAISLLVFVIGASVVLVTIVTPLAVLTWIHRASKNAHAIARRPLEHSPAMAVGWFFVPFANLWQPLAAMREIDTASDPEETFVASSDTSWWWAGYLVGNIAGMFVGEVVHPTAASMVMGAIATTAHAISVFMLVRIIERIRRNQEASSRRRRWAEVFADDAEDHALAG